MIDVAYRILPNSSPPLIIATNPGLTLNAGDQPWTSLQGWEAYPVIDKINLEDWSKVEPTLRVGLRLG